MREVQHPSLPNNRAGKTHADYMDYTCMVTTSRTEEREGDGDAPPLELGATTRRWDAGSTYSNGAGAAAPARTHARTQSNDQSIAQHTFNQGC